MSEIREPVVNLWRPEWTPADVRAAWHIASTGELRPAAGLVQALLGDERVRGVLEVRVRALLGLPLALEPAPGGERAAETLEARWWDILPEPLLGDLLTWGLLLGVGLAHVRWEEGEDGLLWPRLDLWNPGALRYGDAGPSVRDAMGREHLLDRNWFLYTPFGPKRPWEKGLWRSLGLPWLVKLDAIRYWARDNEVGALRVATPSGPAGTTGQELARLLSELGGDTGLVLPEGWTLEMLAPPEGVWKSKQEAIQWANAAISVAILGQNLTTEVQEGSYAAAQVHEMVRRDILRADAEALATALREGILKPWAELNYGDPNLAPWPRWDPTPPADLQARAETLDRLANAVATLLQAGVPLDLEALAQEYGLPLRKPEALRLTRLAARKAEPAGFIQGQLYADALADAALREAPPLLPGLEEEIRRAGSYEEVRAVLLRAYREASPEELAHLMERALVLAGLAGRYGVIRDVER